MEGEMDRRAIFNFDLAKWLRCRVGIFEVHGLKRIFLEVDLFIIDSNNVKI